MEANQFFQNVRREIEVLDFHCLRSTGSERRVKINARIPMGGSRAIVGTPEWVMQGYEMVVKQDSLHRKTICEVEIEGVTVEFFTTPEGKQRTQLLTGATIKQFSVERVGKDEKTEVYLNLVIYAPSSESIVTWLYQHLHESTFAQFDATQASFSYEGEEFEESDVSEDKQMSLVGDEYDADRIEANSAEHDEEFA